MNDQLTETLNEILQNVNELSPEVVQQTLDYGIFLHSLGIKIGCFMIMFAIIFTVCSIVRRHNEDFIQFCLVIISLINWFGILVVILNYINLVKVMQSPLTYVIQQLT